MYLLQENLHQWLTDEKARDQFVIRAATFSEVFWNDPRQMMPELVYRRQVIKSFFISLNYILSNLDCECLSHMNANSQWICACVIANLVE